MATSAAALLLGFLWRNFSPSPSPSSETVYNFISPLASESALNKRNLLGDLLATFRPSLREKVERELKEAQGTYGLVIEDLSGGERLAINEQETFYMASLYKLMVMYQVFKKVAEGELSLSGRVGNSTWGETVESAVTVSDNLAGRSLGERLGWENIEAQMRQLGLEKTRLVDDLISTPADIALFLENLARGDLVSVDSSRQMIEILLRQRLNSRLPRYLPSTVKVAHKTGELDQFRHDVGLVFLPNGRSYLIVVMSKDSGLDHESAEIIARISKAVYDYFSRLR